jgi:hypothetical protein
MFRFLDQRKQGKMQWIYDPNQSNVGNLNHVSRDASRHFRNKEGISEPKFEELGNGSKNKIIRVLYRDIFDLRKCYHPRNKIVKDGESDLVADSHGI